MTSQGVRVTRYASALGSLIGGVDLRNWTAAESAPLLQMLHQNVAKPQA